MSRLKKLGILLFILMLPASALASSYGQLELWKRYDKFANGPRHFADLITIKDNRDWPDFLPDDFTSRDGYFTATLNGPAGTLITLYTLKDFQETMGYLIIMKKDDSAVEIDDLLVFPPGEWTEVKKEKGSYSAFYQPHEVFKFMISSAKWGKWWEGSAPMSNN
ncbi:hypothetical protein JYT60_01340 [bacterium AH-315-C08]|nr:hypothetical protein [bacterium AH-315-C08]